MVLSKLVIFLNMKKLWEKFRDWHQEIKGRLLTAWSNFQNWLSDRIPKSGLELPLVLLIFIYLSASCRSMIRELPLAFRYSFAGALFILALWVALDVIKDQKLKLFYKVLGILLAFCMVVFSANQIWQEIQPVGSPPPPKICLLSPSPRSEAVLDSLKATLLRFEEPLNSLKKIRKEIEGTLTIGSVFYKQLDQNIILKDNIDPKENKISSSPSRILSPIDSRVSQTLSYLGTRRNLYNPPFLNISNYPNPFKLFKETLSKYSFSPISRILSYIYHSRFSQAPSFWRSVISFYKPNSILSVGTYPINSFISKMSRKEEGLIKETTVSPNLQSLDPSCLLNIRDSELGNKKKFVERSMLERIVAVSCEAVIFVFYLRHIR